jgi:ribosomal-protein-alanine N-acetyltransferase
MHDDPWVMPETGLGLRPLRRSDAADWYAYLSDPAVVEHTSWNLHDVSDLAPLFDSYASGSPTSQIRYAIVETATARLLGTIGFHTVSDINRTAELSYDLAAAHWGRGIAPAACVAMTRWGFAQAGFVRIQATVLETNTRSARVLEKCGFVAEGLLRRYRMVRGEPRDFRIYSVLSP